MQNQEYSKNSTRDSCLRDVLIHCTGDKQIIESAKDKFWGTGIPLQDDDCLNPRKWLSRGPGIMGEILTEIREELQITPIVPSTIPTTSIDDTNHSPLTQQTARSDQLQTQLNVNTENTPSINRMETPNHPGMEH